MKQRSLCTILALLLALGAAAQDRLIPTGDGPQRGVFIADVTPAGIDESVVIENRTPQSIDLSGWTLQAGRTRDKPAFAFAFPEACAFPAGGTLSVHAGPANLTRTDLACGQAQIALVWQPGFVLHNDRGVVTLRDAEGTVVASHAYPSVQLPEVVINEVELNPGTGAEWVELFNASNQAADLTGWTLRPRGGERVKLQVPVDAVVPAGGLLVIRMPLPLFKDAGEGIELAAPGGAAADATPAADLMDGRPDARSWARRPDRGRGWAFQACTPGARNEG